MKKFTENFNNKIIQLYKQGYTCYRISKILKCSEYKVRGLLTAKNLLFVKKRKKTEIREYRDLTEAEMEKEMESIIYK